MDSQANGVTSLRDVMRSYPTGVTIVTGGGAGEDPFGLTVNSFTSVSLEPPLVLVCIARSSSSHDRLVAARSFAVNLLAKGQAALAERFASEPSDGRFEDIVWLEGPLSGCPLIEGSLASLECETERVSEGGDHSILLGRVVGAAATARDPLMFHRGRLTSFSE